MNDHLSASIPEGWQAVVDAVASDRKRGADALTRECLGALKLFALDARAMTPVESRLAFLQTASVILAGQPTMAPLLNLFNTLMAGLSAAAAPEHVYAALVDGCDQFLTRLDSAQHAINTALQALVPPGDKIVTISHSSTVREGLVYLSQHTESAVCVTCLESRPRYEGQVLAEMLAASGVPVALIADAAMYTAVEAADIVLFGADCITRSGIVNKIGSAALAALAMHFGKPCYALASLTKFWPPELPPPPIKRNPPGEIWHGLPISAVDTPNKYFEVVPWSLVSGMVCDAGFVRGDGVLSGPDVPRVHPAVAEVWNAVNR